MSDEPKTGALTSTELLSIWRGAVDPGYGEPIVAAGEGNGLEVPGQMTVQLARVSEAVETTAQAMFLKPWSGQTGAPAGGAARARVKLKIARSLRVEEPLVLWPGLFSVLEETTDWGPNGGVTVQTGRRYWLDEILVFHPGDVGPYEVWAEAERPGYGYNNPLVGSLKAVEQIGANLTNNLADTTFYNPPFEENPSVQLSVLVNAANQPDVFIPEHIGQVLTFTAGANTGKISRLMTYEAPDLSNLLDPSGGKVRGAVTVSLESATVVGAFAVGERIKVFAGATIVAYAVLLGTRTEGSRTRITIDVLSSLSGGGSPTTIEGMKSGATATIDFFSYNFTGYSTESNATTWRILDWVIDYGVTVTNDARPTGGRAAMLDALGDERGINRAPGESDEPYRARATTLDDVVAPNAISRQANKVLVPLGVKFTGTQISHVLREVGRAEFRGFFYDAGASTDPGPAAANNYAYDMSAKVVTGDYYAGHQFFDGEEVVQYTLDVITARGRVRMKPMLTGSTVTGWKPESIDVTQGTFVLFGGDLIGTRSGCKFILYTIGTNTQKDDWLFKTWLSFAEMRAFMLIQVPQRGDGDDGMAYDGDVIDAFPMLNAYDRAEEDGLTYDGFPAGAAKFWKQLYQAIDTKKGGGVGFDLISIAT